MFTIELVDGTRLGALWATRLENKWSGDCGNSISYSGEPECSTGVVGCPSGAWGAVQTGKLIEAGILCRIAAPDIGARPLSGCHPLVRHWRHLESFCDRFGRILPCGSSIPFELVAVSGNMWNPLTPVLL
jgi:hypothetical protein